MRDGVTAVILAGGRGTRSADPSVPKLAQAVGGRSLLHWHLDLLGDSSIADATVVAGHLGDAVAALCHEATIGVAPPRLSVVQEAEQRGTVAAVALAAQHYSVDRYVVILGDVLVSMPLDTFVDAWIASGTGVAVAVHPSTHPQDSDAVFPSPDGSVRVVRKGQDRSGIPNMSSAGLFAVTADALSRYGDLGDLGSDVLAAAAADHDLFAFVTSHYLKDTGTPDRLDATRRDHDRGAIARRGGTGLRRAIFLDRDGVINPALPEVYRPEDMTLIPDVAAAIAEANALGIPVFVATNQPGLAKGFMDEAAHEAIRGRMDLLLAEAGAFVDDYAYCPHHPETGHPGEVTHLKRPCECRKPGPGLLLSLADRHGIDLPGSAFVGDHDRDEQAAKAASTAFVDARPASGVEPSDAIRRAIEVVTC